MDPDAITCCTACGQAADVTECSTCDEQYCEACSDDWRTDHADVSDECCPACFEYEDTVDDENVVAHGSIGLFGRSIKLRHDLRLLARSIPAAIIGACTFIVWKSQACAMYTMPWLYGFLMFITTGTFSLILGFMAIISRLKVLDEWCFAYRPLRCLLYLSLCIVLLGIFTMSLPWLDKAYDIAFATFPPHSGLRLNGFLASSGNMSDYILHVNVSEGQMYLGVCIPDWLTNKTTVSFRVPKADTSFRYVTSDSGVFTNCPLTFEDSMLCIIGSFTRTNSLGLIMQSIGFAEPQVLITADQIRYRDGSIAREFSMVTNQSHSAAQCALRLDEARRTAAFLAGFKCCFRDSAGSPSCRPEEPDYGLAEYIFEDDDLSVHLGGSRFINRSDWLETVERVDGYLNPNGSEVGGFMSRRYVCYYG